jgi:cyclophilin family peptidyl-prolyl cis-trans isomerase
LRAIVKLLPVLFAALISTAAPVHGADVFSGSGVVIGTNGEVLTNAHVVENCTEITVRFSPGEVSAALLISRDEKNDLAVVRTNRAAISPSAVAKFREGSRLRAGDAVVVLGYPLSGLLATTANLTVGNVSALAGLGDDSRYVQISAPVQPGNSGGPLLDASGHLVGIVTAKLNAARIARFTGDIPQNVNFALKAEIATTFLESKGIAYQAARSDHQLSPADVGDIARSFTVYVECKRIVPAAVATPKEFSPPAQKVVLYEEDPADPMGKRFVGSAIWRTETVTPGPGQPPDLAIRADVEVPGRKLAMTLALRRNTDKDLPASHTVEIMFKLPASLPSGGISSVPGILVKQAESTRGVPLAGLAVKVKNDFYLIGLSNVESDKYRNLQLLKEHGWFDIPLVYNNNRRAIIAIEKGSSGERAFADAFKAWDRPNTMAAIVPPNLSEDLDKQNTIVIDIKYGRIIIRLRPDIAPRHAERIKTLAREKFYDGVPFHRVIAGLMAQTGDGQNKNGTGGSKYPNLLAEFSNVPFKRGVVGMARGNDPNSANSQFFIMLVDASFLDRKYTVVGEVVSGMDVLDRIKKGEPVVEPDRMIRVQVAKP